MFDCLQSGVGREFQDSLNNVRDLLTDPRADKEVVDECIGMLSALGVDTTIFGKGN